MGRRAATVRRRSTVSAAERRTGRCAANRLRAAPTHPAGTDFSPHFRGAVHIGRGAARVRCTIVTILGCCVAWRTTRSRLMSLSLGSRRACGLNRSGPANARDLWLVHNDHQVSYCYDNDRPGLEEAEKQAKFISDSWVSTSGSRTTGRAAKLSVAAGCRAHPSTTTGARSTRSSPQSRGCAGRIGIPAHSSRTRTGSRSGGRYGTSLGGTATHPR